MSPARRPRVLLADDHLLVAEALKSLLTPEFDLVGVVGDGRALVEAAGTMQPATPGRALPASPCGRWTMVCSSPSVMTVSVLTLRHQVAAGASVWRACANACGW